MIAAEARALGSITTNTTRPYTYTASLSAGQTGRSHHRGLCTGTISAHSLARRPPRALSRQNNKRQPLASTNLIPEATPGYAPTRPSTSFTARSAVHSRPAPHHFLHQSTNQSLSQQSPNITFSFVRPIVPVHTHCTPSYPRRSMRRPCITQTSCNVQS